MMAKRRPKPELPEGLQALVKDIGRPVSSAEVDIFGRLQEIQDRSHRVRTIVKVWKDQQTQDRRMREHYARCLMLALAIQAVVVNVVFVLIGFRVVTFEQGTVQAFILSVFGEIAALVLLVMKYLYTPSSDKILDFLDERGKGPRERSKKASRQPRRRP